MSYVTSGSSTRKREYVDNAKWQKSITATAQLQPVRRRVNGVAVQQQVVVREYKIKDLVCSSTDVCAGTKMESPVQISIRVSGPVGAEELSSLWTDIQKVVTTSGALHSPVLTDASFS